MSDFVANLAAPGPYGINPYLPGKPIAELEREYGIRNAIKLASNENPLGPSPRALAVLNARFDQLGRYPESDGYYLKHKLAEQLGVQPDQLVLGNGSNEVLELIARGFLTPATSAVMSAHCFTVYPIVSQSAGARVIEVSSQEYGHDLLAMARAIQADTRVVFIANPNNPTGTWVSRTQLADFLAAVPDHLVVVLDEAYIDYIVDADFPNGLEWLQRCPRLIVLRTFSKIHGLAGLRVGFGVGDPQIIDLLNRIRQPFNINTLALAAAEAALDDENHIRHSRQVNREGLNFLCAGFSRLGLGYIPSEGNFVAVDLGRPAQPVYEAMLRRGVIVRPVGNYQMPEHLRISVGLEPGNRRCLEVLALAIDEQALDEQPTDGQAIDE